MKSIFLIESIYQDTYGSDVGLLFSCPPDSSIKKRVPDAINYYDLIGEIDNVKLKASILARALLDNEPRIRGIAQLEVFEEVVIRELKELFHAKNLCDSLVSRGYDRCVFHTRTQLSKNLENIVRYSGASLAIEYHEKNENRDAQYERVLRVWKRLKDNGFNRKIIAFTWDQIKRNIDPYFQRFRFGKKNKYEKGRIWFYSTANTFTRIGLLYEPWFSEKILFLVDNPLTGGIPLSDSGRAFISPYAFVREGMAPVKKELYDAEKIIYEHLAAVSLSDEYSLIRDVYLKGDWISHFMRNLLPMGLFQSFLFKTFIDETEPKAVVVGNPGYEAYLLHAARNAPIPTILLQHGILGDFCQFIDPPVDHYIVRGCFWKDFLSNKAAERAEIINPPQTLHNDSYSKEVRQRDKVLFLTAPVYRDGILEEIISTLISVCVNLKVELVIRVHPLEHIEYYKKLIAGLTAGLGVSPEISYSQGPGLEALLEMATVAVTYNSTVFLECLRLNVPIISFGWYDFSYKKQIEQYGVFHFCASLQELSAMTSRAVAGDLPPYRLSVEPFLAKSSEASVRSSLSFLVNNEKAPV
jgi:hypothetical protein